MVGKPAFIFNEFGSVILKGTNDGHWKLGLESSVRCIQDPIIARGGSTGKWRRIQTAISRLSASLYVNDDLSDMKFWRAQLHPSSGPCEQGPHAFITYTNLKITKFEILIKLTQAKNQWVSSTNRLVVVRDIYIGPSYWDVECLHCNPLYQLIRSQLHAS